MLPSALSRAALAAALAMAGLGNVAFAQTIDLKTARVVDLTHSFDETTPYWPTGSS